MVVTNAADGNASHVPTTAERLAALWRTQGHWLLVLIPLSLILIRPLRWCWGSWVSFDSPLVFQPFLPFLAAWLVWERRGELRQLSDELAFVFPAGSPKRRGKLWPVLLSCVTLVIAALAMVTPLAMLAFVGIVSGIVYYLYGPNILKALWQPLLLLILMVPPPGALLGTFSAVLQTVTARIVGALLHLFVGDVRTVGNFIFMPTTPFPIGPSLGGPSVALPTMALTLWWAFRKNVRPINTVILLLIALGVSLLFNGIRTFSIGLIAASNPELAQSLTRIPSWLLTLLAFVVMTRIAGFFTPKPVHEIGEED